MIFLLKRPHRGPIPGPGKVYIIDEENMSVHPLSHERSAQVKKFGNGFAWGYNGAGAEQLALALLLETTNDEQLSYSLSLSFKEDCISQQQSDCWAIDMGNIQDWIDDQLA